MASLFDRQQSLGLNVSKSVTIYVTADTIDFFVSSGYEFNKGRLLAANAFAELVEGIALMGVENINIVFGNSYHQSVADNIYNIAPFLKDIERYRPYINIIASDDVFINANKDIFGSGRGFIFHFPVTAINEDIHRETDDFAGKLTFDDSEREIGIQDLLENFVLLDFSYMITGRFTDPYYAMFDFYENFATHGLQCVAPVYSVEHSVYESNGLFAEDPDKHWLAASTLVLLGVNILIKDRFENDKFVSSVKYLDHSVKNVMNSLAIRPRWKKND